MDREIYIESILRDESHIFLQVTQTFEKMKLDYRWQDCNYKVIKKECRWLWDYDENIAIDMEKL